MYDLKRILDRLGLKQLEFAKLLGVSPRTVSLWATGEVTLPGPVRAYIRMLQLADPVTRANELARLSAPCAVFEEGLYSVTYKGAHVDSSRDSGSAVAMLRAGRIVGSDGGGGKFEGTYQFDRVRHTNHFHVWLRVPSSGKLVTGRGEAGSVVEIVAEFDRADPVSSAVVDVGGQPLGLTLAYLGPLP
jgi:hypothetical protein